VADIGTAWPTSSHPHSARISTDRSRVIITKRT